ncbi:biotin--[acetyl-CoA-carboxylase] ligase [Chlorogloeopsis sp. ULAP01]|uniref:biotin--[acetyl-CoA-carboxylase] ligase n=1 Tax=Chlorogloeopsis sp. ULAP01 TaxID=3056483 RepID=UPI0025AB0B97|nr:biotin--[acetyl-CoA-carboxylase] ligase [Chlorogloeopsis sp. ULAP01]MDM9383100.1 biotin--[acetyl-CoA-carboxylase] ligase [Chlorogloeopsis sp. ULAP01]
MGLNQQQLEAALKAGRKNAYLPFCFYLVESVASTNQTLWALLDQRAQPGCTIIATQQTAGRGQWGRQWASAPGGLYLSLLLAPNIEANQSYQLTFATAWGIAYQLRESGINVGIKWPNDLVINQRKLGGILTETKINQGQITQSVIGVGINWTNPVPETGINLEMWQTAKNPKPISSLEMLAAKVLLGIECGIQCLFEEGVNILLARYLELLANVGDRICVNDMAGTVVGVTSTGELRVRLQTSESLTVIKPEIYLQPGTISLGYSKVSG